MRTTVISSSRCVATLCVVLLCAACTTKPVDQTDTGKQDFAGRTGTAVTQAATTPFSDLNLVKAEIPEVLAAARMAPYTVPQDATCVALTREILALDAALGADLDTPPTASNPGLIERGTDAAGKAASGALRGAAEGAIPFRSWVRRLSGAERYSREVAAAIAAGTVRRAFLKGLGQAQGCGPRAAPAN